MILKFIIIIIIIVNKFLQAVKIDSNLIIASPINEIKDSTLLLNGIYNRTVELIEQLQREVYFIVIDIT